jgi:hypothetical protein
MQLGRTPQGGRSKASGAMIGFLGSIPDAIGINLQLDASACNFVQLRDQHFKSTECLLEDANVSLSYHSSLDRCPLILK